MLERFGGSLINYKVCIKPVNLQNLAKQTNFQVRMVIATGGTVGLAKWIIDGTHVLLFNVVTNPGLLSMNLFLMFF